MTIRGAGLSRRALLCAGAALGAGALLPSRNGYARGPAPVTPTARMGFTAAPAQMKLLGAAGPETPVYLYDGKPFQLVRLPRGTQLEATFENALGEGSSLHFHGIRMPNEYDGVPPLTQPLVEPGGRFVHRLPLDDPGTFFFHPHCDETGQAGRGLVGVLIVEDERDPIFDVDEALCLKDWRLAEDGLYLPLSEPDGAAKVGTFGQTRTVNGKPSVEIDVPSGGNARVRVLNVDSTRIMDIGVEGGEAWLIAVDGAALDPIRMDSLPDGIWRMGPAQRIDIHVRMPAKGGVTISDYRPAEIYEFARLEPRGRAKKAGKGPLALPKVDVPVPVLEGAEAFSFTLQQATDQVVKDIGLSPDDPLAKALVASFCVGRQTFWSIDRVSWAAGSRLGVPKPLAAMQEGRTYRVEIRNETRFPHPVHLHGHTFLVLGSNKDRLPRHYADTVLVQPGEAVEIAFVAAAGDWAFHCHILEHMETGMMGWFRIL